jgi:signal transduction histidine kinase
LQPFGQIQQRDAAEADRGTGLGLPIVKSLVELHGGRFVIDSVQERGTTIALVFPHPA